MKKIMSKEDIKEKVLALIKYYNLKKQEFSKLSETDIRNKLIDRLFKILRWDLDGEEFPSEVQREESIEGKESTKKKADYVFRLGNVPKFVVEAKAIKNINIHSDIFHKQVVGYSYNLACSWGILTNFDKLVVYFVDKEENFPFEQIKDITDLDNFENNFERVLWPLSKEGIREGILEKEADRRGLKRSAKVDKQLYEDLKTWREKLSSEINKNYKGRYESYEIEEIVQRIIDRLIFIRKLEDLELEERKLYQLTRRFSSNTHYYKELIKIFKYYREKYNSGLFGEDNEEQEADRIDVSNNVIEKVITGMYRPQGRKIEYNFVAIDADILGNIYEQYLAYILKETPKKTKLEGGRSHRKEQGIYYTPTYIVDYIIKNTVGGYIKDKTIDEILEVKILDPACGSGSFLIRAFSEICNIIEKKMKSKEKSKHPSFKNYNGRLNLAQKITILTRCIYGLDLDKKATEIAQLNLLLKLLEGETSESISKLESTKKLLPMLDNVKNGNSLIDDKSIDEKAFDWEKEFPFKFDVVIGNPPYVRQEKFKEIKPYFEKKYGVYTGTADLFVYFFERGIKNLKEKGKFGFIVSNKFIRSNYGRKLRRFILENTKLIEYIDDFEDKVFADATVDPCIIILEKNNVNKDNNFIYNYKTKINQNNLSSESWVFGSEDKLKILDKIRKRGKKLREVIGEAKSGIKTGLNEILIVNEEKIKEIIGKNEKERNAFVQFIKGNDIKRWNYKFNDNYLIFIEGKNLDDYPNVKKYLLKYKQRLVNRTDIKGTNKKWYELRPCAYYSLYSKPKIIWPDISQGSNFTFDDKKLYLNNTAYFLSTNNKYYLALLNSKVLLFYFDSICSKLGKKGYRFIPQYIHEIPIVTTTPTQEKKLSELVDKILLLNKTLNEFGDKRTDERKKLEEEIKRVDNQIDQEVYKLYDLTGEEIKIVEDSLK